MKKILMILTVLFVASCADKLDEIVPQQSISDQLAFADEAGARGATTGLYGILQDLDVLGSMPQIIGDFQSDNVTFIGSFPTLNEIKNYITISDNTSVLTIWQDNYRAIVYANAVIANVPGVPGEGFTQAERDELVGQALFIRALVHFQLVNLFAQPVNIGGTGADGIPLLTEPFTGSVVLFERASVGEVHDQIEQDLLDAIDLLPGNDLGATRATVGACHALLSRLYLYQGDYANALAQAETVINTYGADFPVGTSATNFWNSNTSEYVFTIENSAVDNGRTGSGGWASFYQPAEQGARGDCPFSADLLAAFDPADDRLAFTVVGANGNTYTEKWSDATTNADDVAVIRMGEVYLTAAEAEVQENGRTADALTYLNMTRVRAGLTAYVGGDFTTDAEMLEAIYDERRFELAFEGHRRMDLLRLGRDLRPASDPQFANSNAGDDKTILPIPQRERDLNPNLTQNTGY
jgi:hypothetical protein